MLIISGPSTKNIFHGRSFFLKDDNQVSITYCCAVATQVKSYISRKDRLAIDEVEGRADSTLEAVRHTMSS
ncbi:hypothetical protein KDW_09490 [Dictyobacter vulcani]|uniref:Uncharacterized protein n=1 Tax=Dictyobacter vulcani TaxID=2607529 RepID=A0A5J4KK30_9CHLR|nr:hypothetical protein KDW_09490 [Dictyobacter vulcani]